MGEVTELIMDGILCQVCGVYIGESVGHPRTCEDCPAQGEARSNGK